MNRTLGVSYGGKVALLPGQLAPEEFLMLSYELSRNVAKRKPSRGGGENCLQDRGRGDSLCSGPNHRLSTGRSHTFPFRIVQCEIGTHMVARLALRREEGKVFK
jgi:hypothetical protein